MAFDLGGLARGLGAAGGGYLGGQVAGEKESYRRDQIAANEALKRDALAQQRELVGLRRKELDPKKDIRALAAHDYAQITAMLNDIHNQDDFKHMPGFRQHLVERAQKAQGVVDGSVSPEDYQHLGHEFGDVGAPPPAADGGAGGPTLGGSAPPPRDESQGFGEAIMAAAGRSPVPLSGERTVYPPNIPEMSPGAVTPTAAGGTLVPRAPGGAEPSAPPDPRAELRRLAQSDPLEGIVQGPTETAAAFAKRQAAAEKGWNNKLTRLTALIQAEPRADILKSNAGVAPELNRQRVVGGVAKIQNTRALTGQAKALTPVKVQQGQAAIKKTTEETKAIQPRLAIADRMATAAERNATTNEGRLGVSREQLDLARQRLAADKDYRNKLIKKGQDALNRMPLTEAYRDRRAQMSAGIGILKGQEGFGPFRSFAGADQVPAAASWIENSIKSMAQGPPTVNQPAVPGAPAPKAAAPVSGSAKQRPADVDDEVFRIVGRRLKDFGTLYKQAPPAARPQLLKAYQVHTGKAWKGAR